LLLLAPVILAQRSTRIVPDPKLTLGDAFEETLQDLCLGRSGFSNRAFRMAADHGKFAFRSPHQFMQIGSLGRDACGKATGRKPPTVVEALGIGFDDKREQAFAQSG
jgi:hypothetical protein